jgi:hypothetical protein
MVEQVRAKGHLRVVQVSSKVILGPFHASVLWTPVDNFTPPQTPGRSGKKQLQRVRGNPRMTLGVAGYSARAVNSGEAA